VINSSKHTRGDHKFIILINSFVENVLENSSNATHYFWDGFKYDDRFSIVFKVSVVDEEGRKRSDERDSNRLTERNLRRSNQGLYHHFTVL